MDFKDQIVVVTGGGRGIGREIAREFARHRASLALLGRSLDQLKEACQQIQGESDAQAIPVQVDVLDPGSVQNGFAQIRKELGDPAVLVNNAGGVESCAFPKIDLELWEKTISLNLTGAFLCAREVVSSMLEKSYGRIVNISSTAGLKGYSYVAAYCAAKHGLVGLTRALAAETAGTGVTVNCVCPGYTDTGLISESLAKTARKTNRAVESLRAELEAQIPQGKFIQPSEVASAVVWLCSNQQVSVTGHSLIISGGEVM